MQLFENSNIELRKPLAEKLRPEVFADFLGQNQTLGAHSPLIRNIQQHGVVPNLVLWGPPGSGKTTFAKLLPKLVTEAEFIQVNAVDTTTRQLKEIGQGARDRKLHFGRATILFVDEIHRFNRAQQDVLLPFTERGDFSLVGATTENPSYELNAALLSRAKVVVFEPLQVEDLKSLLDRGALSFNKTLEDVLQPDAIDFTIAQSDGDGRKLLNSFEQAVNFAETQSTDEPLSLQTIKNVLQSNTSHYYDKKGDEHYNCISAFIKSIRGSDPDGALYYLARMLKGGEDPIFIARRLVILSSEDVGNADPRALTLAVSGLSAVKLVGLPEASINLAQVTTYLASAPKSNRAYKGLRKAQALVDQTGHLPVPKSLRSSQTKLAKELGFGKDYAYSHEGAKGFVKQEFLPEQIRGTRIYEPVERGFEKNIIQYLKWLKED